MNINELATLVEGTVEGNGNTEISNLSGIDTAKIGDLTYAMDEARLILAEESKTTCILTTKHIRKSTKNLIRVNNPKTAFLILYNIIHGRQSREHFVHPSAVVAKTVKMGKNVWIGSHVSIEDEVSIGDHAIIESGCVIKKNVTIGEYCHLFPNVILYERIILKNNIVLQAGVVVGSDGFGYVKIKGKNFKFPQLGNVIIEDDVEIGANSTIDRGSLDNTVIGAGTKLDNLCHIAHNVKLGKNVLMAAQSGVAGSSTIGDNVMMSGQVAVTDNVRVGNNVGIGGQSAIIGNIKDNQVVWGIPARPIMQTKRQLAVLGWLTKNFSKISKIVKSGS